MNDPGNDASGHAPPVMGAQAASGQLPDMPLADALKVAIELLEASIDFLEPYSRRRLSDPDQVRQRLHTLRAARKLLVDQRASLRRAAIVAAVNQGQRSTKGGPHAADTCGCER